jgi:uncharacterized membrane protein
METIPTIKRNANNRLLGLLSGAGFILLTFAALQLTIGSGVDGQGFNWKLNDFIVIGFLLFSTAILCEFVLRKVKSPQLRLLICVAILLALVVIWIDLAVGIFNIPGFSGS